MAFYKCNECPSFFTTKWPMLKGHLISHHKKQYTEEDKEQTFKQYEISEDDYTRLSGRGNPSLQVDTGLEKDVMPNDAGNPENQPAPVVPEKQPKPVAREESREVRPPETISEYTTHPVERLNQVMKVNRVDPKIIETITNVMALSQRYWNNPHDLEELLVSHLGGMKRGLCQTMVIQYMDGVQIPNANRGFYPYDLGGMNVDRNNHYGYPPPGYFPPGYFPIGSGAPAANPEVNELKDTVKRLSEKLDEKDRDDKQRERDKLFTDKIAELEKKIEGGGEVAQLKAQIEELKKQLAGGSGQSPTMIIYDDKGQPMQLPADRGLMEAIRRKQEVESQMMQTEQMMKFMTLAGGNSDKLEPILAQMKEDRENANKRIEELTKSINDQKITHLEERIKAAETLAANPPGEGKGVLDVAEQAGNDLKEAGMAVAKEVKEGVTKGFESIKEILSGRPAPAPVPAKPRSPEQIGDIMKAENVFLETIGER